MIPPYQSFMLPLLRAVANGQDHRTKDLHPNLAKEFHLTDEEQKTMLPSGTGTVLYSRIQWARTYLKQAGLLDAPARGFIRLSEEGRRVIESNPPEIDVDFLRRYPAFLEFEARRRETSGGSSGETAVATPSNETPEETLEKVWSQMRSEVAEELLERLHQASVGFFEVVVVQLLVAMGYGGSYADAASVVGKTGDEGIDGIIKEDRLGLDAVYIQAKRWQGVVGRPDVQKFAGSLEGARARKGVMITTSTFSAEARSYVKQIQKQIVLVDGRMLSDLMIEQGVGVAADRTYVIPRIDEDFFEET